MLIRTIFVMVFIAPHMPLSIGHADVGGRTGLLAHKRTREVQILFRFDVVGVESDRGFVMCNCTLVLTKTNEEIGQFLVSDRLGCVQRQGVFETITSFFRKLFVGEGSSQTKFPPTVVGTQAKGAFVMLNRLIDIV